MRRAAALVLGAAAAAAVVSGQKPARIGPDGKPLLNRPERVECEKRISHMKWQGHNYFLSWREPWHKFEDWDWFNGRNFCRDRCMDLVSFDSPGEYELIAAIMKQDNVSSIYTSGRKCNFKGKGCDAEHLQPINVNGWFWAGAANKRIPATTQRAADTYWSFTGEKGEPQPDNAEGVAEGPIETEFDIGVTIEGLQEYHDEACLAVLNDKYNDGIAWHDVACHFRSVIVCEDSDQLVSLIHSKHGVDVSDAAKESEKALELESVNLNEVAPLLPHNKQQELLYQQQLQEQQRLRQLQRTRRRRPPGGPRPAGPPRPQAGRRPNGGGGFLGSLRRGFPFLF